MNAHGTNKSSQTHRHDLHCFEITAMFKFSYGQLVLSIVRMVKKKSGLTQGIHLVGQIFPQVTGEFSSGEDLQPELLTNYHCNLFAASSLSCI